jgi:hypothetical protein
VALARLRNRRRDWLAGDLWGWSRGYRAAGRASDAAPRTRGPGSGRMLDGRRLRRDKLIAQRGARLGGKNRRMAWPCGPCRPEESRLGAPRCAKDGLAGNQSNDDVRTIPRGRFPRATWVGPFGPLRDTRTQIVTLSASPTPSRYLGPSDVLFRSNLAGCVCSQRSRGPHSSTAPTGRAQPAAHLQYGAWRRFCQATAHDAPT